MNLTSVSMSQRVKNRCRNVALLLLLVVTTSVATEPEEDHPLVCELRQYNFTAVQTDAAGRKCVGQVSTHACYGSCDTHEYGDASTPGRRSNQDSCAHSVQRVDHVTLTDCDDDAPATVREYSFVAAVECACRRCDPTTMNCMSRTAKRRSDGGRRRRALTKRRALFRLLPAAERQAMQPTKRRRRLQYADVMDALLSN